MFEFVVGLCGFFTIMWFTVRISDLMKKPMEDDQELEPPVQRAFVENNGQVIELKRIDVRV